MLFLKFVQGLPVVGVIGGLSDTVFLHRIQKFAKERSKEITETENEESGQHVEKTIAVELFRKKLTTIEKKHEEYEKEAIEKGMGTRC